MEIPLVSSFVTFLYHIFHFFLGWVGVSGGVPNIFYNIIKHSKKIVKGENSRLKS